MKSLPNLLIIILYVSTIYTSAFSQGITTAVAHPDYVSGDCNDTSGYKSMVDLEELAYLKDHFYSTATKVVPGLGEIAWRGNCLAAEALTNPTDRIGIYFTAYEAYDDFLLPRENFACSLPKTVGVYPIHSRLQWEQDMSLFSGGYGRLLDDGDVFDGWWDIDTTCTNYVEIIQISIEDQEIRGRFELHFIKRTEGNNGNKYSDRIHFVNGDFYAYILRF